MGTLRLCPGGSGDHGLTPGLRVQTGSKYFFRLIFFLSNIFLAPPANVLSRLLRAAVVSPAAGRAHAESHCQPEYHLSHSQCLCLCNDFYHHPSLIYFPISGFIVILTTVRAPLTETAKTVLRCESSQSRRHQQPWRPPHPAAPRRTSGSHWSPRG